MTSSSISASVLVDNNKLTGKTGGWLLVILVFLVYLPALNAGFVWDDDIFLSGSSLLKSTDSLWKFWTHPGIIPNEGHYWPLVYSTFWLEYHLWGLNPMGYHFINIFFHAFNVVLLWFLLRKLNIPGAFLASAIFALHPVHVESVAWVIERKDVLSGLFYFASLLAFFHYDPSPQKKKYYICSVILFIFAMLSKSITISLPIALFLILWWKNGKVDSKSILKIIPFAFISILLASLDYFLAHQHNASTFSLSPITRLLIAGKALWFYTGKLFLPIHLMTIYPRWTMNLNSFWLYLYPLAIVIILILLWIQKKHLGLGAFFCTLYFIITLLPILGFIDFSFMQYSFVADRFQYLACLGLIVIFSSTISILYPIFSNVFKKIVTYLLVIILLLLGIQTLNQSALYKDIETLFGYNLTLNPRALPAHTNLGVALAQRGNYPEAVVHFKKALELNPNDADTLNNLGVIYANLDRNQEAVVYFQDAVLLNPKFFEAYNNLGACYMKIGKKEDAITQFKKSLNIFPGYSAASTNLQKAMQ